MTQPTPDVSICIANYNGQALLADCLESVAVQATEASIQVIVHDDASSDASLALLAGRYPWVEVIASPQNVGFCTANNRMAAQARGEYLLLLNNDAALQPDAVACLLSHARSREASTVLTLPQYDWESGALVDRGCLLDPFHTASPNLDPGRGRIAFGIGACLWIPRAQWEALGGFPEWFGSIAEDVFLCRAARLRGLAVRCLPASGYRHRQGMSFGGNRLSQGRTATTYRRRYLSERNRTWVVVACTPGPAAWPWLAMHVATLGVEGAAVSLASGSWAPWQKIYWPALRDAWAGRARVLALRHTLQSQRRIGVLDYLRDFTWRPRKLAMLARHGLPRIS